MASPQDALTQADFQVADLGAARFTSPRTLTGQRLDFVSDEVRMRRSLEIGPATDAADALSFERAGPRERLFFDPGTTTAALVTCGGLAPGLNNVIRSAYLELTYNYGVQRVLGIQEGYRGLVAGVGKPPLELTFDHVHKIHNTGGTLLGTSRGGHEPARMVDFLVEHDIDILFCIGGDGTQRGAHALDAERARRRLKKAIVGIPKTIDNDIPYVWMSFGYATAVSWAEEVLRAAHTEARSAPNGVGLVKLMGRNAGFIAAGAAVASQDANFVLVPEIPFPLDGFLEALHRRVVARGHALVVVAEGAGQHLLAERATEHDASGNALHQDIGVFLKGEIKRHFAEHDTELNLKYLDPSYLIRGVPANAWDRILSDRMARHAVHAAMAGKTDVLIGFEHSHFIHVPISTAVATKRHMQVPGDIWAGVLSTTGQPSW